MCFISRQNNLRISCRIQKITFLPSNLLQHLTYYKRVTYCTAGDNLVIPSSSQRYHLINKLIVLFYTCNKSPGKDLSEDQTQQSGLNEGSFSLISGGFTAITSLFHPIQKVTHPSTVQTPSSYPLLPQGWLKPEGGTPIAKQTETPRGHYLPVLREVKWRAHHSTCKGLKKPLKLHNTAAAWFNWRNSNVQILTEAASNAALLAFFCPDFLPLARAVVWPVETLNSSLWLAASELQHVRILYLSDFSTFSMHAHVFAHQHTHKKGKFSTAAHSKVSLNMRFREMKYPAVSTVYYNLAVDGNH